VRADSPKFIFCIKEPEPEQGGRNQLFWKKEPEQGGREEPKLCLKQPEQEQGGNPFL
jgi:hypothetical protein